MSLKFESFQVLTLDQEVHPLDPFIMKTSYWTIYQVDRIWKQKLSGASILFLINRYITPIQFIIILVGESADIFPCRYPSLMKTSISGSTLDANGVSNLHYWLPWANEFIGVIISSYSKDHRPLHSSLACTQLLINFWLYLFPVSLPTYVRQYTVP